MTVTGLLDCHSDLVGSGETRRNSTPVISCRTLCAPYDRFVSLFEIGAAVQEALFGKTFEAKRDAAAIELSKGREVLCGVAIALALAGESSKSEALANDLEKRFS